MPTWRTSAQIMEEMAARGTPISEDIATRMSQLEQEIAQEERAAAVSNESNPQNIQVVDLDTLYERAQQRSSTPTTDSPTQFPPGFMPPPRSHGENFFIMISIAGLLAAYMVASHTAQERD